MEHKTTSKMMDTDSCLALIYKGFQSFWLIRVYLYNAFLTAFVGAWAMLAIVFVGAEVSHRCHIPPDLLPDGHVHPNQSIPTESSPDGDGEAVLSKCHVYVNYTRDTNETMYCPHGWEYGTEMVTIVSEWNLVCNDAFYPETAQTVLVLGVLVGAMVMAILSDLYGRKVVTLASVLAISVVTFITAWVNNYYLFTALRFFAGVLQQGVVLPGFVYGCELFPASQRTVAGLLMQCTWGMGVCLLALMAYFIRDWRNLLIATAIPGAAALPLFWMIPESLPWLVAKGKYKDARRALQAAAKTNDVNISMNFLLENEEEQLLEKKGDNNNQRKASLADRVRDCCKKKKKAEEEKSEYTLLDVVKSAKLRTFAFIMCYLWCVSSLVYYGLSLSSGSLAGDRYVNFFLSGVVEIPAYLVAAVALHYIGRRYPISVFHLIAGLPLLASLGIPKTTSSGTSLTPLLITFSMISKCGIAACFGCVFLWAPELFPTTIRNASMGIASVGGRLGNIFAPMSSYVAKTHPWIPGLIFGILALIAGGLVLLLPETLHRPLPLTIEEVEKWARTVSKKEQEEYKLRKKQAEANKKEMELRKMKATDESALYD